MANELTVTVALDFQKENSPSFSFAKVKKVTIAGTGAKWSRVSVGITEEAIPLDEVTAAGAWMCVLNEDDTNYIEIRSATGAGNDIIQVKAGEPALFRFGSDVTAPFWIANTAACKVSYFLIST